MTLTLKRSRFFPFRNIVLSTIAIWGVIFPLVAEPFLEYQFIFKEQLLTIAVAGILNFFLILYFWVDWRWERYTVDQNSLTHGHGVFFRSVEHYSLDNINSIIVKQNLLGMIIGFGNIRLYSPFSEEPYRIRQIPNPLQTAQQIEQILPDEIPIHRVGTRLIHREKTDATQ